MAQLDLHRLKQRTLEKPRPQSPEEDQHLLIEFIFRRFQIWAKRGLSVVWTYECARAYERWLDAYMQAELAYWEENCRAAFQKQIFLSELKRQLLQACAHWSANALKMVAAVRAQGLTEELGLTSTGDPRPPGAPAEVPASGPEGAGSDGQRVISEVESSSKEQAFEDAPQRWSQEVGEVAEPVSSTWEEIFAKNPYPRNDPRHDEAIADLLTVKEHLDLYESEALDKRPPEEAPVAQHVAYLVGIQVGRFDILARGLSNRCPLTYASALVLEQFLDKLARDMLAPYESRHFSTLPTETIIRELKVQLECRKKYWTGQALKRVREAEEVKQVIGVQTQTRDAVAEDRLVPAAAVESKSAAYVFRRQGEFWELIFSGQRVMVGDLLGLGYIADLLRSPRTEVEALALSRRSADDGITQIVSGGIEAADDRTIREVQLSLAERRKELSSLEHSKNWARKGQLEEEIQKLEQYIMEAQRAQGIVRKTGGTVEKARIAVTNAIQRACKRIRPFHPKLATHSVTS